MDGFSLFLELVIGVGVFAAFRWAKNLRNG